MSLDRAQSSFSYYTRVEQDNQQPEATSCASHACICIRTALSCCQEEYPRSFKLELLFCIIFAAMSQIQHTIHIGTPNQRPIPYMITANSQDVIINLTHNHDYIPKNMVTIPDYLLVILGILLPVFLMITASFVLGWRSKQTIIAGVSAITYTLLDLHSIMCVFLIAYGGTRFFTDFVKYYVGYLRPNFYTMCQYSTDSMTCESNDEHLINSARRSFPSGHASVSFCGMMCLGLYLSGKVGIHHGLQQKGATTMHTTASTTTGTYELLNKKIGFLLSFGLPMFLSTFIAASRVHDNWHHPADIVAGSLIGATSACIAYHLWYPSVVSPASGIPIVLQTSV